MKFNEDSLKNVTNNDIVYRYSLLASAIINKAELDNAISEMEPNWLSSLIMLSEYKDLRDSDADYYNRMYQDLSFMRTGNLSS